MKDEKYSQRHKNIKILGIHSPFDGEVPQLDCRRWVVGILLLLRLRWRFLHSEIMGFIEKRKIIKKIRNFGCNYIIIGLKAKKIIQRAQKHDVLTITHLPMAKSLSLIVDDGWWESSFSVCDGPGDSFILK
jgi:hypothetical protein